VAAEAPARSTPATAPAPHVAREQEPDPPTVAPDHDAASQAEALITAAEDGVPFCEECEKARLRRELVGA
jgi:hypothetical protein